MKKIYLLLFLLLSSISFSQEICDNGIDDDSDGLIDLNDSECICNSVQSIIPNPSFEEFDMCPNWFSQMNYCADWMQGTNTTTDFFHKCNYILPAIINAELDNFPDGNGIGSAIFSESKSEYLGSCLNTSLESGSNYQMTFHVASLPLSGGDLSDCNNGGIMNYDPIDLTLYGSINCNSLPLNTIESPTEASSEWIILGSVNYTPVSNWGQVTINFTSPININTILLGAPEILPVSYSTGICVPYFLFDNILLNKSNLFGVNITQQGSYCENNLILTANATTNLSNSATYQWYNNGIAIIGANSSTYPIAYIIETPGNYNVKVVDGTACYISPAYFVNTLLPFPDINVVQPTCYENGNITITIEAEFYSFNNGVTWGTENTVSNLLPGIYFVKTKNGSGCISSTKSVLLEYPAYINQPIAVTITDASCGPTGSITVLTSATEYSVDNGLTWSTNPVFNNLTAGAYWIRIKDENGCMSEPKYDVIHQYLLAAPTYISIDPDCFDQNGSITITTPAAAYSFDNGLTWTTNPALTGLSSGGPYWIIIKDSNGCISLPEVIYLHRESLDYPDHQSLEGCGSSGSITITTQAYEYSINDGISWFSTPEFTNLSPGYYSLKIKDENGCTSLTSTIYLSEINWDIVPEYTYTAPDCHQSGSITIQTPAYEYSFNGGYTWTTNNVLENLAYDHVYSIMIKNSNGCQSPISYINTDSSISAPDLNITQPSCKNPEGSISVTSTAYQYSFDNGTTWSFSNESGPLPGGTYLVITKTDQDCESPATEVTINDAITIPNTPEVTITNPTCTVATGSITINTAAAFYSFDNGATWGITNTLDNLIPDTYHIRIKNDENGCSSLAVQAIISSDGGPTALPGVSDITYCQGETPTTLTATGSNLLWYDSPSGGIGFATAPVPSATVTGTYTYYVTQTIGNCESQRAAITVTVWPTPQPPMANNQEYCQDDVTTALTATGNNLLWYTQPAGGIGSTTAPLPSSHNEGTFNFYVSQSSNGCESERTTITVLIKPTPDTPETEVIVNYEHLSKTTTLTATGINIKWYDHNLKPLATAPVPSSANIGSTTYYVSQTINGCESPLKEITVIIARSYITIDFPKFFTPNGDGQNETWNIVTPKHGIKCSVIVFDRYGKIIKGMTAPGAGWDGTFNNKPLPATDYWFLVKYTEYGAEKEFKSHFSLIR